MEYAVCRRLFSGGVVDTNGLGVILLPALLLRLLAAPHQMFAIRKGKELHLSCLHEHVDRSV